jgi:hypothetical protein
MPIMKKPLTKSQYPKTIKAIIDKLVEVEAATAHHNKIAKEFSKAQFDFENYIIETFKKTELEGAQGKTHQLKISRSEHPVPKNWPKIYDYIVKNKAFDLLQKRLSSTAVKARWKDKKVVPGIEKFDKLGLSLTKVSPKKK